MRWGRVTAGHLAAEEIPIMARLFHGSLVALTFAALLRVAPATGSSWSSADIAAGKRFAGQYCATCHTIAPGGPGGWTDAPDFASIANRPNQTAGRLSAFIQEPHIHMLNDRRPPIEAHRIAAYIMSLRGR